MTNNKPTGVDQAICDLLEGLYSVGKIDYETYRKKLAENNGLDRLKTKSAQTEVASFRKKFNLSQNQLAKVMRVSKSTVAKWESGANAVPGPATVVMDIISKIGLAALPNHQS